MSGIAELLQELDASLRCHRAGSLDMEALITLWRGRAAATPDLSDTARKWLEQLLMRCESSRLFSEDSCSFSRTDILAALESWLDAVRSKHLPPSG